MSNQALIQAMLDPGVYPHPAGEIRLLETHSAWVILAGEYAYKVKKPVNFGFLDFSTLERRHSCCEEEVRLNRRFAPQLYLGVIPISGSPEQPVLNGSGEAIEYAVQMRRFPEGVLLSEMSSRGELEVEHIDQLVESVAGFHQQLPPAPAEQGFGEPVDIHHWSAENFQHIRPLQQASDDSRKLDRLERWSESAFRQLELTFGGRRNSGAVRECHGDLHLGNIVLLDGRVTPFDCIEFNPRLRFIDVLNEVAFLFMDLWARGHEPYAWRFLNGYLEITGDYAGLRVLRYYLVYRAMVRAKVAALRRHQLAQAGDLPGDASGEYQQYLQLAKQFSSPGSQVLLITHGLSGSGKSTVAQQLCENRGLIRLRSDVERKRLAGLAPSDSSASATGEGLYTGDRIDATYRYLVAQASVVLESGYSVVVDATFLKRAHRQQFLKLARDAMIPFVILTCEADQAELERRILSRCASGQDASEATLDVLHRQQAEQQPLSGCETRHVVRIDTASEGVAEAAAGLDRLLRAVVSTQ